MSSARDAITTVVPWNVDTLWWIITGTCNLSCKHCYIDAPSNKYKQLTFNQCLDVVKQAKEAGKKAFITGGEPFFRPDLMKIIDKIHEAGLNLVGIETNATLLTKTIITTHHQPLSI